MNVIDSPNTYSRILLSKFDEYASFFSEQSLNLDNSTPKLSGAMISLGEYSLPHKKALGE